MTESDDRCLELEGTWRSRDPRELLNALRPDFPRLGITRIADVTGLDCIGIPVAVCIRPNSKNLAVAQGKGVDPLLATLSALMESIEDYHSENPRPADRVATQHEISQHHDVVRLEELNAGYFPGSLHEHDPLPWVRTTNLCDGGTVYLPHACIDLDTTVHRREYAGLSISSTGLASGGVRDEAICHALFEVIERDAHARWIERSVKERREYKLALNDIAGSNAELLARFAKADVAVDAWDMPSATDIPVYRVVIRDLDPSRNLGAFAGMGAHLSPHIALSRALTEAAQSRLTVISGSRDDMFSDVYARRRQTKPLHVVPSQPGARAFAPALTRAQIPANFAALRETLIERLHRVPGVSRVLAVDHELGVAAAFVHVIVPGMRDLPM